MYLKKRGLSPVIAVVLLVLITVIAAGIIVGFVVPFVRDVPEEAGKCFKVLGDLVFDETPYNCFNSSANFAEGRTGFSVRIDNDDIIGFRVSLQSTGSSNAVEIEQDVQGDELSPMIRMLLSDFGILEVPGKGEVRTYVAKGLFDKAEIFPILKDGGKCDIADDIRFSQCDFSVADDVVGF